MIFGFTLLKLLALICHLNITQGRPYLAIVDDDGTELLPGLGVVEGAAGLADLDQQGLPLGQVFTQAVVDVLCLHVPQALVLQPDLLAGMRRKGLVGGHKAYVRNLEI